MITASRAYLILVAAVSCYVMARAACVPWVQDEAASLYWYVERGEFLPFRAHWDAGNHPLNSAIGLLTYRMFGLGLFVSRLGSVAAFLVFAWATFRIGSRVTTPLARWCLWLALLMCPFMIDFFSLFRGYGLEVAFWMVAIDGSIRYADGLRPGHLVQALTGMLLANAAVLSLVPLWAAIIAILGVVVVWRARSMERRERIASYVAWLLLGVGPLVLGVIVALEMRAQGLLYHGSMDGLYVVTAEPLVHYIFGDKHPVIVATTVVTIILSTIVVLWDRNWRSPGIILSTLFWGDLAMRLVMAHLLGVNFPQDRAALHLVPLAILLVAFAADRLAAWRPKLRHACLILLVLPVRWVFTINVDHTTIWPEQSVPQRFLHRLAGHQDRLDRPLMVGTYGQLALCVPYGARLDHLDIGTVDHVGFLNGSQDVRIIDDRFVAEGSKGYHPVDSAAGNKLWFFVRDEPLRTEIFATRPLEQELTRGEFLEVWRQDTLTSSAAEVIVEISGALAADTTHLDLMLVSACNDSTGAGVFYHGNPLSLIRPVWNGERFHVSARLPALPGSKDRVVYFWNVRRTAYSIRDGHIVLRSTARTENH